MPTTLTDSVNWDTPISAPASGDLRRASTVETPLQQLANRTAYLKDQTEVTGVKRIQYVADSVAAKALTGLTEGDVVLIGRFGLYVYGPGVMGFGEPWQYAVGTKYLVHTLIDAIGASSDGLVATSSSGDLARPDIVPYRTVIQNGVAVGSDVTDVSYQVLTGTSSWTDVTNGVTPMSINLGPADAGDIIVISASGSGVNWAAPPVAPGYNRGGIRARVTPAAGSETSVAGGGVRLYSTAEVKDGPWAFSCRHVLSASEATNVNVKLQAWNYAADMSLDILSPISLQCQIIRP